MVGGRAWRTARTVAIVLLTAVLAGTPAGAAIAGGSAAADEPRVRAAPVGQTEREVRRYWTPERIREAVPIELHRAEAGGVPAESEVAPGRIPLTHAAVNRFEVANTNQFPARVHGKVFLTFPGSQGGDFVCSATAVGSAAGNAVVTAGHCVFDAGPGFSNQWATNWMFVPGYRDGQEPFGRWVARSLAAPPAWVQEADIRFDVGGVVMEPRQGSELEGAVGARGVAFEQERDQLFMAFGYPQRQPPLEFTGGRLFACEARYGGDDPVEPPPSTMRIACDMTEGSSGGGWVTDDTYVNSVISYGYLTEPDHLYGPYFGPEAAAVYDQIAGPARCFGEPATLIGTGATETLRGTRDADVILGLAGDDEIKPGGGDDLVCAGSGADSVRAGPGDDRLGGQGDPDGLRGQAGRDTLNGGPDDDVCDGGPGRDQARRCEDERHID
jgi:V8-like Glu-specific endopeptidase